MKLKSIILIFIFSCLGFGQWSTSPDPDSSLYVCPGFTPTVRTLQDGSSFVFGMSSYNLWLQKLDPYGYKQWVQPTHVIQNSGSSFVYNVPNVVDNDGGIIVWWQDHRGAEVDQFFNPSQNGLYIQRINKFGQKVWSDTGIQIAPVDGGIKKAYGIDDGVGGVVLFLTENDFNRTNKTNTASAKLMRFSSKGKKLWELLIDTSTVVNTIPNSNLYRLKDRILYYTRNGWQLIDTASNKSIPPSIVFGGVITDGDSILFNSKEEFFDSLSEQYSRKYYTKYSSSFTTIWSVSYISKSLRHIGDGGAWADPVYQLDNAGGLFTSNGYYFSSPFKAYIYEQHITKDGPIWGVDGIEFQVNKIPVRSFNGHNELGLIFYDFSLQKFNSNGDSLYTPRVQVFNQTEFDIDNTTIASDNNGGAIIAFWRGGIFAQHTGRTGKLGQLTSVNTFERTPKDFVLHQNYPNPFNPNTTITYQLPKSSFVTLKIFDLLGRETSVLVNESKNAGSYSASFDAARLSGGVYFYSLKAGSYSITKKMMLLK